MQKLVIAFFIIFSQNNCAAQDTLNAWLIKKYQSKIDNYLDLNKKLQAYYRINKNGITIFSSATNSLQNKAEFFINWKDALKLKSEFKNINEDQWNSIFKSNTTALVNETNVINWKQKVMKGMRIAIDPGHIAGDIETGKLETKYISFVTSNYDSIKIAEGMLTYATALILKEKLEKDGAIVFITRNENGNSAFGLTFEQWLKSSYRKAVDSLFACTKINETKRNLLLSASCSKREKFKTVFKDIELAERCKRINAFNPDISIIIHYNVDETNTGWQKPTSKNFNMAFVAGAFVESDMQTIDKRAAFTRLLLSDDIENSIHLSTVMLSNFESILKVKTADVLDATYLSNNCKITTSKGVYCRNLQLTRNIKGTLIYGETLYQDNEQECILLNNEKDKSKNKRVQQVAEAYYKGLLEYIANSN
jgi:N-acetylmuramoyl-L-alanine amidase